MKLTAKAIEAINVTRIRLRLAMALDCTEQTIIRLISANKENSPLTTAKALEVIKEETSLEDSEILFEVAEKA